MNTNYLNNVGIRYEISNFKLERGLYLNPIVRRVWRESVELMAITQGVSKIEIPEDWRKTLQPELDENESFFQILTEMHSADVFDALYVAAERRYGKTA